MGQFIKDHFDKILLSLFLLLFFLAAVGLVLILKANPDKLIDWMTREFDIFAGALIGLITGAAAGVAVGMKLASATPPPTAPTP
jgi:hypothetical protein